MNEKTNSVINTVPAAKALHQVPLFDPLKLLRKTTSRKTGEKVLKLDLSHKKTWFLLVHPRGRMLTNILRLTDQMAIFEAQLFADRSDNTVLAQFTSCHTRSESGPEYIRNAQDEALNEALDNAGFGIQLSDLVEPSGNGYGSEVLLSQVEALLRQPEDTPPQVKSIPVMPPQAIAAPVAAASAQVIQQPQPAPAQVTPAAAPKENPEPAVQPTVDLPQAEVAEEAAPVVQASPVEAAEPLKAADDPVTSSPVHNMEPSVEAVSEPASVPKPIEPASSASTETANILQMLGGIPVVESAEEPAAAPTQTERPTVVDFPRVAEPVQPVDAGQQHTPQPAVEPMAGTVAEVAGVQPADNVSAAAAPTYTEDMTVDEIRSRMTVEQAKALKVTFGPNNGWTLGQVLERRASSLKFYALVSTDASNAIKAGSFLLLDELNQARAG